MEAVGMAVMSTPVCRKHCHKLGSPALSLLSRSFMGRWAGLCGVCRPTDLERMTSVSGPGGLKAAALAVVDDLGLPHRAWPA